MEILEREEADERHARDSWRYPNHNLRGNLTYGDDGREALSRSTSGTRGAPTRGERRCGS